MDRLKTQFIPEGYHVVTPYVVTRGLPALLTFLKEVFDAKQKEVIAMPHGIITHAEIMIGDSVIMFGEAPEDRPVFPSSLYIYVPDVDSTYRKALALGAESLMEPADQYYGDRNAGFKDSVGNQWWVATHVEDVSEEEIQRRAIERRKK